MISKIVVFSAVFIIIRTSTWAFRGFSNTWPIILDFCLYFDNIIFVFSPKTFWHWTIFIISLRYRSRTSVSFTYLKKLPFLFLFPALWDFECSSFYGVAYLGLHIKLKHATKKNQIIAAASSLGVLLYFIMFCHFCFPLISLRKKIFREFLSSMTK